MKALKDITAVLAGLIVGAGLALAVNAYAAVSSADQLIALGMPPELARKVVEIVQTLAMPVPNNTWITWQNAAHSGSIDVLKVNSSDNTLLNADTGNTVQVQVAGTTEFTFDNDKLTISGAAAKIIPGATSLTFRDTADAASNLVIADGGTVTLRGDLALGTSGGTVAIQEATAGAACSGTLTANGATPVVTSTTCAATGSRIFLSRTSAETGVVEAWISAISNGVSFSITGEAGDTGSYNWIIFHEAA